MNIDHNDASSDVHQLASSLVASQQLLGLTGPDTIVDSFTKYLDDAYPGVSGVLAAKYGCKESPPLSPLVKRFSSGAAMDAYLSSDKYGRPETSVCGCCCCITRGSLLTR